MGAGDSSASFIPPELTLGLKSLDFGNGEVTSATVAPVDRAENASADVGVDRGRLDT